MSRETIFISMRDGDLSVRRNSGDGETFVDSRQYVYPGQTYLGLTYEQLKELGPGQHEIGE